MAFPSLALHGASPLASQATPPRREPAERPISLPSTALLQGRNLVQIEHNGALYQLRSTRLGKLILTK